MKILTSFFQRQKEVPFPVAISRVVPPGFRGSLYRKLAPTRELEEGFYKGRIDSDLYIREYLKLLENRNLSPDVVVRELPFACTLLCWERPYEFCHRHVVARWIETATGIQVKEYGSRFIKPGLGIS